MPIKRIGIIVGGGPAPGTNGVISAVAIEAIKVGCVPIGFHDGFDWLAQRYTDEQHELTIDEVSRIHLDGGVLLGSSRRDVTRDPESLENTVAALAKLKIDALVCIGGDDMVRSAVAIERRGVVKVVQVPKSIDNDLWLPLPLATLGYETARHVGVGIVKSLMEDAKTTGRWYLGVTMGRPTGHLTLGIGKAASATCTIIPEEFPEDADLALRHRRHRRGEHHQAAGDGQVVRRRPPVRSARRALQPARGGGAAGRGPRRAGQHPGHGNRPRTEGQERGPDAARAARHQGDDRGQDDRLRAAMRPADPVRRRVRARSRLRRRDLPRSTADRARS